MGAVAADHIAEGRSLAALRPVEINLDRAIALRQRDECDAPLADDAERCEVPFQYGFRRILRYAERGIGEIREILPEVAGRRAREDDSHTLEPDAGIDQIAGDAYVLEHTSSERGVTPIALQ